MDFSTLIVHVFYKKFNYGLMFATSMESQELWLWSRNY